jgi:hypothetical protein
MGVDQPDVRHAPSAVGLELLTNERISMAINGSLIGIAFLGLVQMKHGYVGYKDQGRS